MRTSLAAGLACLAFLVSVAPPARAADETAAQLVTQADELYQQGHLEDAEAKVDAAVAAARAASGPDSADEGEAASVRAWIRYKQNRYPEAEAEFRRALALAEKNHPAPHAAIAMALQHLGFMLKELSQYAEAEQRLQGALAMREQLHGPMHAEVGNVLAVLGNVYSLRREYAKAEAILRRTLAIAEATSGPDSIDTAVALNDLGLLMSELARYDEAVPLLERARAIASKVPPGRDMGALHSSMNNLAGILRDTGRLDEAEALMLEALALDERDSGPESQSVATLVNQLGLLYVNQGRYEEGEKMHRRSLAIREKVLGPEHDDVAISLNNLGMALENKGQLDEAGDLYQRAIAIHEKRYGPDDPSIAINLGNYAINLLLRKKPAEAEPYALRGLAMQEAALGPDHPDTLNARNTVAGAYSDQGKYDLAFPMYRANIAALEKRFGPDYLRLALDLTNLAMTYWQQKRPQDAIGPSRQAVGIVRRRFIDDGLASLPSGMAELRTKRSDLLANVLILSQLAEQTGASDAITAESFETAQLARASSVGDNVAQMATRFAGRGDSLATQVRDLQDARQELASAQAARIEALAESADVRNADAEAALDTRIAALHADVERRAAAVDAAFPEYAELVRQAPVAAREAQALLGEGEALVVYAVTRRASFAWVVRPDRTTFHTMPATGPELATQVDFVRSKLLPDAQGSLPTISPATSAGLYQAMFAPLEADLAGAHRVFVVADGALQALPFGVLGAGDAAAPEWLARRYAFATLPSVGSLRALRRFERGPAAPEPFAGFGDPRLGKATATTARLSAQDVFTTRSVEGLADVQALREAPSLPETADELRALAAALQGSTDALFLQDRATEAQVKGARLDRFRFLAFATHGVMAGELQGTNEPGLVLTPPATASAEDDGYLAASEVAALTLHADWVVLSACNTAAADGKPGAEGLSGLANAFFYAGSRALLVSNWPVASQATRELVSTAVANYAARPGRGKPEALQDAMLAMMAQPQYAHPFYWAPFTVVGD